MGIDAPRGVSVHRQEVFDQISSANRAAASTTAEDVGRLAPPRTVGAPQSQRHRKTL